MSVNRMKKIFEGRLSWLMIVLFFFTHCHVNRQLNCKESINEDYHISAVAVDKLPKTLKEISGLALSSDDQIWCINDEKGKIFIIDTLNISISSSFDFGPDGDYEAIAISPENVHVIQSDGMICSFPPMQTTNAICRPIIGLPLMCETESLAIKDSTLFTICKGAMQRDRLQLYQLKLVGDQWYASSFSDWTACLSQLTRTLSIDQYSIHPSDLYFDHKLKVWIMLSVKPSLIVILDMEGNIVGFQMLDEEIWPQPEGICGAQAIGEFWLSSEGNKKGTIGKLKVHPK